MTDVLFPANHVVEECLCPPSITDLFQKKLDSRTLTWTHPCDGPPTTHYVVTMLPVSTSKSFTMQDPINVLLSPSNTSITFNDLKLESNNYVFVVTAVSGNVSLSSQPRQSKMCMYTISI